MTNGFGSSEEEGEEEVLEEPVPDNRPPSRDRRRMRQISTSLIRYKECCILYIYRDLLKGFPRF